MTSILKQTLSLNRPNLSEKSLKSYASTLKSLYKKVYPDDLKIEINKFINNQNDFLEHLQNVEYNRVFALRKKIPILSISYQILTIRK